MCIARVDLKRYRLLIFLPRFWTSSDNSTSIQRALQRLENCLWPVLAADQIMDEICVKRTASARIGLEMFCHPRLCGQLRGLSCQNTGYPECIDFRCGMKIKYIKTKIQVMMEPLLVLSNEYHPILLEWYRKEFVSRLTNLESNRETDDGTEIRRWIATSPRVFMFSSKTQSALPYMYVSSWHWMSAVAPEKKTVLPIKSSLY